MKQRSSKPEKLIWLLLFVSVVLYLLDYTLFGDGRGILSAFMGNFAFLPVYVLFVTLMIERILKERERDALRRKMNMVIGLFFTEAGTALLAEGLTFMRESDEVSRALRVTPSWKREDFDRALGVLARREPEVDSRLGDLERLRGFLCGKREVVLRLLENPNLLEHDAFTDLLWAIVHLIQELEMRPAFAGLPQADMDHLSGDIRRVYSHLFARWIEYMKHLREDYPYLYSLAVRTNPLNPDARVVITAPPESPPPQVG